MWILYALLASLAAAIVVILSKAGIKNIDSSLGFAIQSVLILLVSWGVVVWKGNLPDVTRIEKNTWIFLILAGIITCISSLLTFRALKLGNASQVSPLERVSLVFVIVLSVIFLKERISWQIILGAVLMAVGALIIALAGEPTK
jgi:transporter family protein